LVESHKHRFVMQLLQINRYVALLSVQAWSHVAAIVHTQYYKTMETTEQIQEPGTCAVCYKPGETKRKISRQKVVILSNFKGI
jgi:hypothetical protein